MVSIAGYFYCDLHEHRGAIFREVREQLEVERRPKVVRIRHKQVLLSLLELILKFNIRPSLN